MKFLFTFILIPLSQYTFACSCSYDRKMEEVFTGSTEVFLASVTSSEKVGVKAKHGELQEYELTLSPKTTYKGKTKISYVFTAHRIENIFDDSIEEQEVHVGGCGLDVEVGREYVILVEENADIYWGWCSYHILPKGTHKYEFFMDNVQDWL